MHRRTAELVRRASNSESDVIDIVGHPINAYNMIKEWYTPVTPVPPGMQGKSYSIYKDIVTHRYVRHGSRPIIYVHTCTSRTMYSNLLLIHNTYTHV